MRKTRKGRKAFWHNIKFKYKLTIINENTLEEVVGIHVSKLNGLSVLLFSMYSNFSDSSCHYCFYSATKLSSRIYEQ